MELKCRKVFSLYCMYWMHSSSSPSAPLWRLARHLATATAVAHSIPLEICKFDSVGIKLVVALPRNLLLAATKLETITETEEVASFAIYFAYITRTHNRRTNSSATEMRARQPEEERESE